MYLIRSGHVAVLLERAPHAPVTQIAGPGSLVGLPAVMTGRWFGVDAQVLDDATLIFVPRDVVRQTLSRDNDLSRQAVDELRLQVQDVHRTLANFALN